MKTIEARIQEDKSLLKSIEAVSYYSIERFIEDAKAYVKAIEQNRMICIIGSVAASGMSRTIKFASAEKSVNNKSVPYYHRNYYGFFKALGYKHAKNQDGYFTISGCGMDMIFHTNYCIIRRLQSVGVLNKEKASRLEQKTPNVL